MPLFHIKVGTRVRRNYGGEPHYGTVTSIDGIVPWITVKWDKPVFGLHKRFMPGELEDANAPRPAEPDLKDAPF
jgi:hypothetical protein